MTLCLYVLPFLRYSASKNSMTLKTRLGVIENGAIPYTTLYWFACFRHCNHSTFWYRFWVIWRWIILWPWNLGLRSLKIIQTDTIRMLGWGFLFAFHSNYGSILHNNRRKAIYWSKILIFILPCIPRPRYRGRGFPSEYCHPVWCRKNGIGGGTRRWKNFEGMCKRLDTIPACDRQADRRTDDGQTCGQTSCHGIVAVKTRDSRHISLLDAHVWASFGRHDRLI